MSASPATSVTRSSARSGRGAGGGGRSRGRFSPANARVREALTGYAFILPNLIVFTAFMFLPLVLTFVDSTKEASGFGPSRYVGFANYDRMFSDSTFWRALVNTLGFAAISLPLALGFGLALALLLNTKIPFRGFFRAAYFVPTVISTVAAGSAARWIFNENVGIANKSLDFFGIGAINWESSPFWASTVVIGITLWARVGVYMVVYLAALQSIPRESYEAAAVDGASWWQQFRHITLPGLRFATAFLAVYAVIESFQVFDLIYLITKGGPGDATTVLGTYAYKTAFETRERGYGAAIGVVLYLLLMVAALTMWLVNRRRDER